MKVSIIIPYIRPEKMQPLIEQIHVNAGVRKEDYEIIAVEDINRVGCPQMVANLTEEAKYNYVMFLGDDTLPQENFLKNAVKAMTDHLKGHGLVGLWDDDRKDALATHWLASKTLLKDLPDNQFFNTAYNHFYCDRELTEYAFALDCYRMCKNAVIKHDHPAFGEGKGDEKHDKTRETFAEIDQKIFWSRKQNFFWIHRPYIGIAEPFISETVPAAYHKSFIKMQKPQTYLHINHRFNQGEIPSTIAGIRNDLVFQALETGCNFLIMLDTDQVYPEDAITKALQVMYRKEAEAKIKKQGRVGAVTGVVCKRYPPFSPLLLRGSIDQYLRVPDEEIESGKVIEIDATGCGFIAYSCASFIDIPHPWFEIIKGEKNRIVGEDILYCHKLREYGFQIYADTSLRIGHLSTFEIDFAFYRLFKNMTLNNEKSQRVIEKKRQEAKSL